MFKFSSKSKARLAGVDSRLADLIEDALAASPIDFGIPMYGGRRSAEEQALLFRSGKSKCDGVIKLSEHQSGKAVDVFAYINGKASWDRDYYFMLAGVIMGLATMKGLSIRWGGDWNGNMNFKDQTFNDLCHFEIID